MEYVDVMYDTFDVVQDLRRYAKLLNMPDDTNVVK